MGRDHVSKNGKSHISQLLYEQRLHRMKILTLCNRKTDPNIKRMLSRIYRQSYKTKYIGKNLNWRKTSEGLVLFDEEYQTERYWIPPTHDDVYLLPPSLKEKQRKLDVNKRICFDVPNVSKEVFVFVFKYLEYEDLFNARLVCKKWKHIITTSEIYWKHNNNILKRSPWRECKLLFHQFVQHMFIGITIDKFIKFIFKHNHYLLEIVPGKNLIHATNSTLTIGNFIIYKQTKQIYESGYVITLDQFLENYRRRLLY